MAALLSAGVIAEAAGGAPQEIPDEQAAIDGAIAAAKAFLTSRIGPDGSCENEFAPDNPRHGGKTALCVHALLTAGGIPKDEPIAKAMKWLSQAKLHGTYAVAMRASAYADIHDPAYLPPLKQDVEWLIKAAGDNGAYTYTSLEGRSPEEYDNSNSQMAVLGVWAAVRRGLNVPREYWRRVETHWIREQGSRGGWGYAKLRGRAREKTYGSMTAAGVATMLICFDNLERYDSTHGSDTGQFKPAEEGIKWLGMHFSAEENPNLGANWFHYWLYSVARVGLASGRKYFGGHNWYDEGARRLLAQQQPDGSWGAGDRTAETAFALLFLVRGRNPVLFSKLQFTGRWNSHPRDLARFTDWLGQTFERPVSWQIVDLESPLDDWHDAPILYISGDGPIELAAEQIAKLRAFALRGGLILSEAARSSGDFTTDMHRLYKRVFPEFRVQRLPKDHALCTVHFPMADAKGLFGVSNGIRLLAVHSPHELSGTMQLGPAEPQLPWYQLVANVCLYATDKGMLQPRGARTWPQRRAFQPKAQICLARLKYEGMYDPEPLAWSRLAILIGNRHGVELKVSLPMEIAELDAAKWPFAALTGTAAFELTDEQAAALRNYLAAGGTLIVDAAGGSRQFADCGERLILPLPADAMPGFFPDDVLLRGPETIERVNYRRLYSLALGPSRHNPRIQAVRSAGRIAVVYSRDDVTAALAGCESYGIRGYTPETAVKLMTNVLFHLAGIRPAEEK